MAVALAAVAGVWLFHAWSNLGLARPWFRPGSKVLRLFRVMSMMIAAGGAIVAMILAHAAWANTLLTVAVGQLALAAGIDNESGHLGGRSLLRRTVPRMIVKGFRR